MGKIDVCSVAYYINTLLVISKEEECDLYGIPSQWSTYPLGGRASMTSQSTYRELTPKHAARKVPVPHGREYQREVAVHIVDNWNQRPTVLGKQTNGHRC